MTVDPVLRWARAHQPEVIRLIREFVELDSDIALDALLCIIASWKTHLVQGKLPSY